MHFKILNYSKDFFLSHKTLTSYTFLILSLSLFPQHILIHTFSLSFFSLSFCLSLSLYPSLFFFSFSLSHFLSLSLSLSHTLTISFFNIVLSEKSRRTRRGWTRLGEVKYGSVFQSIPLIMQFLTVCCSINRLFLYFSLAYYTLDHFENNRLHLTIW